MAHGGLAFSLGAKALAESANQPGKICATRKNCNWDLECEEPVAIRELAVYFIEVLA